MEPAADRSTGRPIDRATTSPTPRVRPDLAALPAYVPGRPAGHGAGPVAFKISSNENPYPPLPGVIDAVAVAAQSINRYPDLTAAQLTAAIADRFGVGLDRVAVGTGSVGVLQQIVQATCRTGDEVVFAWRSFEAYPIVVGVCGAVAVPVPLGPGARHDLDAMAAAVTDRTRLILVCSPNNPTGTVVHTAELERFLDAVPPEVVVVIDEAYVEFVREPEAPDALSAAASRPNVVVLRTFSKAYGLAGLRVGYAIADPTVAAVLRTTAVPFGVSTVAQAAAVASLAAEDQLAERVDGLVAERQRVVEALRYNGWEVPQTEANFVWLPVGDRTTEFTRHCADAGLTVRPFTGEGVRCTVGESEANDRLIAACEAFRR